MTETLVILAAFVYIATWAGAYKHGYENGERDARLESEQIRQRMIERVMDHLPPEQSPR